MTDEDLLARYAHPSEIEPGKWWLGSPGYTYSADSLAGLIRAQLELGVKVTETFNAEAFAAIVTRLRAVERRVEEIEAGYR